MIVSNFALIILDKTGALPDDDTAIIKGDRSTIEGIIKLDNSGESTTLTGIFLTCAIAEIDEFFLEQYLHLLLLCKVFFLC